MNCKHCRWDGNIIACRNMVEAGNCPMEPSQYVYEQDRREEDRQEWADILTDIQAQLGTIVNQLEMFAREEDRRDLEVYMIAQIKTIMGGMGYRTHNTTVQDLIDSMSTSELGEFCEMCGCELQSGEERDVGICGHCQEVMEEEIAQDEALACA